MSDGILDVDGNCTIQYANSGIDIENSSGLVNGMNVVTIQNCSQCGLWVGNCSPVIDRVIADKVSTSTYQNGGVTVTGGSSDPFIQFVTIKGDGNTSGTYYGISIGSYADATVDYTDIQNSVYSHSISISSGGEICLQSGGLNGNNNIDRRNSGVKAINNPSTGSIIAQNNWWGADDTPPSSSLFSFPALVSYTNWLTSPASAGAGKAVFPNTEKTDFQLAQAAELKENYDEAVRLYKSAFRNVKDDGSKRRVVKALLRVMDKNGRDYGDLRVLINGDIPAADGSYKAFLRYIEDTILFREGRYSEALAAFVKDSESFRNSEWEVQMLASAARIAGAYLNDKSAALMYADRAGRVNPGANVLRFAYEAAGSNYNPTQYEDVFAGKAEYFGILPEPAPVEFEEYVSISPNPANPVTTITYSIKNPSDVKLTIYSINGQKVATLVNGPMSAGRHSVTFNGAKYASGVYFYHFESAGMTRTGKMLLLK